MAPVRKFETIAALLRSLPPEQHELRLTLPEIEKALSSPLPCSAWTRAYWHGGTVARNNWLREGFVARFDRRSRTVSFTRPAAGRERPPGPAERTSSSSIMRDEHGVRATTR